MAKVVRVRDRRRFQRCRPPSCGQFGIYRALKLNLAVQRGQFTKAALTTLESIRTLEEFLMKHKMDYVDPHLTAEQERDSIEHEATIFIKTCKERINVLKNSINEEEANAKGWLSIRSDNSNADTISHKHGVLLILSEKLHSVTSQFDKLEHCASKKPSTVRHLEEN